MQITLPVRRIVKEEHRHMDFPRWMEFATNGEKISAIKALRDIARSDSQGVQLSLVQSKRIVEHFMECISTTSTRTVPEDGDEVRRPQAFSLDRCQY